MTALTCTPLLHCRLLRFLNDRSRQELDEKSCKESFCLVRHVIAKTQKTKQENDQGSIKKQLWHLLKCSS